MPTGKDVSTSTQIEPRDFKNIADSIIEEFKARKKRRGDLEKHWDEIDRQIRMEPELSHKQDSAGKVVKGREWLPETELPLQAQTLEILLSDVRRLKFPKNRDFFTARAALTEKYLSRFDRAGSPFPGEVAAVDDFHAVLNQDNADKLVEGTIGHWHAQYDFRSHQDQIEAEALKYGFGPGRIRKVDRRILGYDARITELKSQKIPVLIPRSARNVYLDDNATAVMHEGFTIGPNIIQKKPIGYADLVAAAKAGGDDPTEENGGWVLNEIQKLSHDTKKSILLLELEGDLVLDRSDGVLVLQDVVITVAMGSKDGKQTAAFVRYREGEEFSTYIIHNYHIEGSDFAYGASPLLKGMPIARLAAQVMNRIVESSQLKNAPPTGYDKNDQAFAGKGGPNIEPYALWPTTDLESLKVYTEVGGDPTALWRVFLGLVNLYAEVTGVTPPRLGAETKSHTTAFAKGVELDQGAVRTVDFVNSVLEGPMTRFLQLEYRMGLSLMRGRHNIYIPEWNEFVAIKKQHLPDIVKFTAIGSGAPAEEAARNQQMLSSGQLALQLDAVSQQQGNQPVLNVEEMIKQVLDKGGWDLSQVTQIGDVQPGPPDQAIGAISDEPEEIPL